VSISRDVTLKKDQVNQLFKLLEEIIFSGFKNFKKIRQNTNQKKDFYLITMSKESIIHTIKTIRSIIGNSQK
jgi:hypothetical protein